METACCKQEGGWLQWQVEGGWRVCEGRGWREASRRPPRGDCTLSLDVSSRAHRPPNAPSRGSSVLSVLGFVTQSCPTLQPHRLQPARLLCPWGFSRREYWSGLPCPPPEDLSNPGTEPSLSHCRWILDQLSHQGSQGLGHGLYGPWGRKESDTDKRLSLFLSLQAS